MRTANRWVGVTVAAAGVAVCLAALIGFLLTVSTNNLPWRADQDIRDFYLIIGESYAQGFTVGFFLCFFLTLAVVAAWPRIHADRRRVATDLD